MSSNRYMLGELAPAHTFKQPRKTNRVLRVFFLFLLLGAVSVGGCVTIGYHLTLRKYEPVVRGSTLLMQLKGSMALAQQQGMSDLLESEPPLSVDAVRRALDRAATDERIVDVVLVIDRLSLGFGTVEALREMMFSFRDSDKPLKVLIEADAAGELELYLAAAGTSVMLSPQTAVSFNGLSADLSFFGGALEKLGLTSEFVRAKKPSESLEAWAGGTSQAGPVKASMQALVAGTWKNVVKGIARDRGLAEQSLLDFAQRGLGTAQDAVKLGLVDKLGYRDQLLVQSKGPQVRIDHYLAVCDAELESSEVLSPGPTVALIVANGDIVVDAQGAGRLGPLIRGRALASTIRSAARDKDVAAILLWVDSSGGSMVGSDLVWREIQRVREVHQKPVVVSMGSVAASGGYWISVGADAIVAAPSTVTGSIGVSYGRMRMQDFLGKLGVKPQDGEQDLPYASLDTQQRLLMEGIMGHGYQQFVKKVARGRRRSVAEIEAVAKGQVWTGKDAREHGLVDRVGGILTAVRVCKEKLALDDDAVVQLRSYPTQSFWWRFFKNPWQLGLKRILERTPVGAFKKVKGELAHVAIPGAWAPTQ